MLVRSAQGHRLVAVPGLAGELQAVGVLDHRAQPGSEHLVVVGDGDP